MNEWMNELNQHDLVDGQTWSHPHERDYDRKDYSKRENFCQKTPFEAMTIMYIPDAWEPEP